MSMLRDLHIWKLEIPLRVSFRHASAERSATSSVWVEATGFDGVTGYGEGCPRTYVTGEDLDSCHLFFMTHRAELMDRIQSIDDLVGWCREHQSEIDAAPAAWCAIEMALLDLLARSRGEPWERLLNVSELAGVFQYTAVLGDQSDAAFVGQLQQYLEFGFQDFKVKLSGDSSRDRFKLDRLLKAGRPPWSIRVDANNLWQTSREAEAYLKPLSSAFMAIEEPLRAGDYPGMRQLAESLGKVLILDESFQGVHHFPQIEADPAGWLINLRISKMGGLLRSLDVAEQSRQKNMGLIIGAQVGETSLLTRSALTVAHKAGPLVRAQEGAFGTRLLNVDVVDPSLAFGAGGRLEIEDFPQCHAPLMIIRPSAYLREFRG